MTRRILKEIRLDRIAAVDRPCQEGAVVTILKRASESVEVDDAFADRVMALRKKMFVAKAGIGILAKMRLEKAWVDEAHKKGGEAKKLAAEHHGHHRKAVTRSALSRTAHSKGFDESAEVGRMVHDAAATVHMHAANSFDNAAAHYQNGNMREGDRAMARGHKFRGVAQKHFVAKSGPKVEEHTDASGDFLRDSEPTQKHTQKPINKKWSDAARKAAAMARANHHEKQAAEHYEQIVQHLDGLQNLSQLSRRQHEEAYNHHRAARGHFDTAITRYGLGETKKGDYSYRRGMASARRAMKVEHSMEKMQKAKSIGAGKVSERVERKGEHLGPQRPKSPYKNPRRSLLRALGGPHRGKSSKPHDAQVIRTGPRTLPGGERKRGLRHKAQRHERQTRKQLQHDVVGRIQAMVSKSAIILAKLPDPETHVRKVIGNTAADYIHDFVNSTNPKFKDKDKEERIRMALGAFYGRK